MQLQIVKCVKQLSLPIPPEVHAALNLLQAATLNTDDIKALIQAHSEQSQYAAITTQLQQLLSAMQANNVELILTDLYTDI